MLRTQHRSNKFDRSVIVEEIKITHSRDIKTVGGLLAWLTEQCNNGVVSAATRLCTENHQSLCVLITSEPRVVLMDTRAFEDGGHLKLPELELDAESETDVDASDWPENFQARMKAFTDAGWKVDITAHMPDLSPTYFFAVHEPSQRGVKSTAVTFSEIAKRGGPTNYEDLADRFKRHGGEMPLHGVRIIGGTFHSYVMDTCKVGMYLPATAELELVLGVLFRLTSPSGAMTFSCWSNNLNTALLLAESCIRKPGE